MADSVRDRHSGRSASCATDGSFWHRFFRSFQRRRSPYQEYRGNHDGKFHPYVSASFSFNRDVAENVIARMGAKFFDRESRELFGERVASPDPHRIRLAGVRKRRPSDSHFRHDPEWLRRNGISRSREIAGGIQGANALQCST